MNKTLVIGATGQIGRQLIHLLKAPSMPCLAMVRTLEQQTELESAGIETVLADLETTLPKTAFEQCDKIVFTAGSGSQTGADKTILVDLWGAIKVIEMAKQFPIKQFVMVSSRDAGDPEQGSDKIKHYNVCKHFADKALVESGLAYTILRPGRLTNETQTKSITTKRPINVDQQVISRSDVANCIFYCLKETTTINQIYELYKGQQSIEVALSSCQGQL